MTDTPCTHTPGEDCCNLERLPCPLHFTQLVTSLMTAAAEHDNLTVGTVARDLAEHRWTTAAAMTMCALLEWFSRDQDETVEQAMARVTTDTSGLPPDERADKQPWVFRLGLLVRAALAGDGTQIAAVLSGLSGEGHDPAMTPIRTLSLFASLAVAAHDATQSPRRDPDRDVATVATFMILGSQTVNADAYRMLVPLVGLTDSFRRETSPELAARRIIEASRTETVAAIGVVGRAVGQMTDRDGPLLFSTSGVGGPAAGHDVTGVVDWPDTRLDDTRPKPELCLARGMRAAVLFARDDSDGVMAVINGADNPAAYARDLIMGACALLGNIVAARYATTGGT
jgi:hypothetical protein